MADLRRRLLLAATTIAVVAAITWLLCSCTKVQSGPDDDDTAPAGALSPIPDDDPVLSFSMGVLLGGTLGFLLVAASVSFSCYCHFSCGDHDEYDEEAADAKKEPCIVIRVGVNEAVPGGCKN